MPVREILIERGIVLCAVLVFKKSNHSKVMGFFFHRACRLDDKIQWLTDYKQYKTDADAVNVMLNDTQNKLESCEKPTSNKAERDKQNSFINVSFLNRMCIS